MKKIYSAEFLESIYKQTEYFKGETNSEELGERFVEAVKATTMFLAGAPQIGFIGEFRHVELQNIRIWPVKGLEKYLVFYIPHQDSIEFIYLIHSARDYKTFFDQED